VIGLPLGEAGPDGRARDMLVASRIIPLRLIQCCRPARADRNGQDDDAGAPDVGKNHDLVESSVPVTTTNHLTQQPHVKNQPAETLTHVPHGPLSTGAPISH
jgi:hypothetical protein